MNNNKIGFECFPAGFTTNNTFISDKTSTLLSVAPSQLAKLNAAGNTVLITDPYLFPNKADATYPQDLLSLLKALAASKIIYCAKAIQDTALYQYIDSELQKIGTTLSFTTSLDDCHDRFWYCPETEKCVIFGTSLNGKGKKICRIDALSDSEVSVLKQLFIAASIINGGDDSES